MEIIHSDIPEVLIINPKLFEDSRGYFFESFSEKNYDKFIAHRFIQDNESRSSYGVIRGLHFQKPPYAQSKLVRVVLGSVLDVAVDIRKGSPTYGKWVSCLLTEENHTQFYIPRGFAHGFSVLSDTAIFQYKCDNYYHPESEGAIAWNDSVLSIDWKINTNEAIISEKDSKHPFLKDIDSPFIYGDY